MDVLSKISARKEVNNFLHYDLFDFFINGKN
jgi:hypothetical protein